jgi:hypothetical protein
MLEGGDQNPALAVILDSGEERAEVADVRH